MKNRFSFEYKISGIVLLMLALVTVIGVYTYDRFSEIVNKVSDAARPDMKLITAKGLLNDLSEAEISVKSFTITKDEDYLSKLDTIIGSVDNKLAILHAQVDADSSGTQGLDSLDFFIEAKFQVLDELVNLQDQFRVKEVLDKVTVKIEEEAAKEDTIIRTVETRRKLFGWRKTLDTLVHIESNFDMTEVNKEIQNIGNSEKYRNRRILARELELVTQGNEINLKIKKIFDGFELAELAEIKSETAYAEEAVKKTNKQIAIFCSAIGLLLVLMTVIILNYVKNNNRYRKALNEAKAEAEALAMTKERFVATMSHEIRTPMNALAGFTEQIAKGPLSAEQREKIVMVQKSTDHLLGLVNEVLDLTKLQNNKLVLDKVSFSPKEIITEAVGFLQPLTEKKSIEITNDFSDEVPPVLLGDAFRLRQVLINLLSNAIKFTPNEGTVNIAVNSVPFGKKSNRLRLIIADSGIGMTPEQLENIFVEFEQAEASTARNYGGTGLGLTITKKIVDLHKGKIEFKSELGKGTEVHLELPYRLGTGALPSKTEKELKGEVDLTGMRILVADDESYNRKLLISILKKRKAIITEVADGEAAVNLSNSVAFDLVLMDIRMPVLNGMEATKQIRINNIELPIIGLTASLADEYETFIEQGMTAVISKPFKEADLMKEIKRVLEGNTAINSTQNPTEMSKKERNLDFKELEIISDGDPSFYKEMLETFVSSVTKGVAAIKTAFLSGDWIEMADESHKIAPSCKHLSANLFYKLLKDIERKCRNQEELNNLEGLVVAIENEGEIVIKAVREELKRQEK